MDKESLVKHHFWILLVLAILLLPVVIGGVAFGVADETTKQSKVVEEKKKALAGTKPKGDDYLKALEAQAAKLEGEKSVVWQRVYDAQKGLIEWPRSLAHLNPLFFGEVISDEDINQFRKAEVYVTEFEELANLIKPTELTGGWKQAMRYVPWGDKVPTNEEV